MIEQNHPSFSKTHTSFQQNLPQLEHLQLLLSHTDETFFLVDTNYRVLAHTPATSQKVKDFLGQELQVGTQVLDLAAPENKQEIKAIIDRAFQGETVEYEGEIRKGDAEVVYYKNRYKPVRNEQGHIIGALVTTRNITESKKTEQDLQEKEQRLRFALEGSHHGLWEWNIKTGSVYFSQSWKNMFGFEKGDISDRIEEWEARLHPEDRPQIEENLQNHLNSKDPFFESIYRFKGNDDTYRWVLARGMLVEKAADGSPLRMIGTHTDITDKRMLEENYRILFNANPLPMWTYDLETLRFLDVNQVAVLHYGYSKNEFLSMTILDIRPKEEAGKLLAAVSKYNVQAEKPKKRWLHQKKNGEIITVNVTSHTLEKNNRKIVLIVAEDITAKVQAEKRLKQSQEQYKTLFESNPLPTFIYDTNSMRFLKVNQAAIAHYGFTKAEFLQMTLPDIHPEEQLELLYERMKEIQKSVNVSARHWKHKKKNGEIIFVNLNSIVIRYHGQDARLLVVHDVTSNVLAEKKLITSNERFELAAKAASEALWEWDVGNDSIYTSPVYKDLFGFEIDPALTFEGWQDCIHPEDRKQVLHSFHETIEDPSKDNWQYEYRYRKADGGYLFISDHFLIIRNEAGKAQRVIGALQDISQRKEAEHEILISNERFAMASKATSDAIYDWDITRNALVWGEGMYQLFGYQSEEISLANWESHVHESERDGVLKSLYQTLADKDKKFWRKEYRFRKKDGEYRYVVEKGYIIRNESGQAIRMIGAIQDITDIKQKEIELTKSYERFDAVIKATNDMIWDWDLETGIFFRDQNGVNTVYGVANEEDIKNLSDWLERIHPADQKKIKKIIRAILKATTQETFELEYRFKRDDGRYAHIYDRGIIICNQEGKPVHMIGAAQDITLRKKLEQQLLQKELEKQKIISKATIDTQEQERREIGKELHDNVNQVLTTTKLYLELAQNSPDLQNELMAKAVNNVVYVINEIRQLSRSLMDPSIGDLGLLDAIRDLIDNIHITRQLQVTLKGSKEVEDLLSDNQKLMVFRILQEALNNAIRHAQATSVVISLKKKEKKIELIVQDNGIGFHVPTTKKGAGLKNIQNRVYLASGSLQIDSAPGKGCQIMINFPIHKKH